MNIGRLHDWSLNAQEAEALQLELRETLDLVPYEGNPSVAAGADCAYDEEKKRVIAGVVLVEVPSLKVIERVSAEAPLEFPYIPGLLSFREAPALIDAFRKLEAVPGVAFFDAHGIAHPRGFGLACHMGLWLDIPTVGIAKSVLIGTHDTPARGFASSAPLRREGKEIGRAFRAAEGAEPVYVSPGHKIDIKGAMRLTRLVSDGKRVPMPTRVADKYVRELMLK